MGGDSQLTAGGFSVDGGTIRGDTELDKAIQSLWQKIIQKILQQHLILELHSLQTL